MSGGPHKIPVAEGAELTLRWRRNMPTGGFKGAMFDRIAFDNILLQPGCEGIRIYMGLHDGSGPEHENDPSLWTYVMVGTDVDGNDMTTIKGSAAPRSGASVSEAEEATDGDVEQKSKPCPPECGDDSPLNSPP